MLQSVLIAALLLPGAVASAETCRWPEAVGTVEVAAVQVVFGPLPVEGDPRVVHHVEHVLLNDAHLRACLVDEHGVLDGYTGPDTLHLVWRGLADAGQAAFVADRLREALPPSLDQLRAGWAAAEHELAVERALSSVSESERLLQRMAPPGHRYQLDPRGPVRLDVAAVASEWTDGTVSTAIAVGDAPVLWKRGWVPNGAPSVVPQVHPPVADRAWKVDGQLSCSQRRALRAVLAGVAETTGGEDLLWLGPSGGVVGLVLPDGNRVRRRNVLERARAIDRRAVAGTARRMGDVEDRTWMAVGAMGLGVCPALEPLSDAHLLEAWQALFHAGELTDASAPALEGVLPLPVADHAALWQAGEPPPGWDDHPRLFHTRTPGGFVVDGPRAVLEDALQERIFEPTGPVVPGDPVEQVLVLSGAQEVPTPCRPVGLTDFTCPPPGALRVPDRASVWLVDAAPLPGFVQVDVVVGVVDPPGELAWTPGTHGSVTGALAAVGTIRDLRVRPEGSRSRLTFTVPAGELADVLPLLEPVEPDRTNAAVGQALDADRTRARPWLLPLPEPSPAPSELGEEARLVVLQGDVAVLAPVLEAVGWHVERVVSPAQLEAEARPAVE